MPLTVAAQATEISSRVERKLAELQSFLNSELEAVKANFNERALHLERQAKADDMAVAK